MKGHDILSLEVLTVQNNVKGRMIEKPGLNSIPIGIYKLHIFSEKISHFLLCESIGVRYCNLSTLHGVKNLWIRK